MLGKRRARSKQWANPAPKRMNLMGPKQYGTGYNPKQVSGRKPAPNAEVKWHDYTAGGSFNAAASGFPTYAGIASLNAINQGDQPYERNGNKITATKLTVRGTVEQGKVSDTNFDNITAGAHYYRWMVIIDTQTNGATPPLSDIFEETPTGGDSFDIYNSLTETGRYKVLMDKILKIDAITPTYNSTTQHYHVASRLQHFKKTFKINLPIRFSDQYNNMASIRTNNLLMVIFCGSSNVNASFNFRSRLRFTDY